MATWRNGWFKKMNDHSVHTTPPPSQNGCSHKNLSSNHPCHSKWLVWHSSTSPNHQRRLLPSLLYLSFFYCITVYVYCICWGLGAKPELPVIGWVDNLHGPTGLIAGASRGVIRSVFCK